MSFEILEGLTDEWAAWLPDELAPCGALDLLRTSRRLFAHAWFDYDFMAVACLVGLQAFEAALRARYPEAGTGVPLRRLVDRAEVDGGLPAEVIDHATAGVELRNMFSHPMQSNAFTVGIAGGVLETTHRLVAVVLTARPVPGEV